MAPVTSPHTSPNASFFPECITSKIFFSYATMAPQRAAAPKKDKAPMQAGKPAVASWSVESKEALRGSRINSAGIDKVRHLAAARTNEHGATRMEPASNSKLREGYYPIFLHTLFVGLVPPLSDFLEIGRASCRERV